MKLTDNQNKSKTTASNTKKTVTKDTLNSRYSPINDKQEGPKGLTKISKDSDHKQQQQQTTTERTHTQTTSNHHQEWKENTNKPRNTTHIVQQEQDNNIKPKQPTTTTHTKITAQPNGHTNKNDKDQEEKTKQKSKSKDNHMSGMLHNAWESIKRSTQRLLPDHQETTTHPIQRKTAEESSNINTDKGNDRTARHKRKEQQEASTTAKDNQDKKEDNEERATKTEEPPNMGPGLLYNAWEILKMSAYRLLLDHQETTSHPAQPTKANTPILATGEGGTQNMNRNSSHIGQTQSENECRYPTTLQEDNPQGITEVDTQETPQQERDDNSRRTQAEAHKDQASTQSKAPRDQDSTDKGNDRTKDKTHKDTNATNVRPDRLLLDRQDDEYSNARNTENDSRSPRTLPEQAEMVKPKEGTNYTRNTRRTSQGTTAGTPEPDQQKPKEMKQSEIQYVHNPRHPETKTAQTMATTEQKKTHKDTSATNDRPDCLSIDRQEDKCSNESKETSTKNSESDSRFPRTLLEQSKPRQHIGKTERRSTRTIHKTSGEPVGEQQ